MASREFGLITPLHAQKMRPSPLVYGFPITFAPLRAKANTGLFPIPPGLSGDDLWNAKDDQADRTLRHLLGESAEAARIPFDQVAYVDALAYGTRKQRFLLAIAGCQKPRMDILPQGEDMDRLKELMRSFGITAEPQWYRVVYN
ncbi:hypothetical protein BD779DRAFT_1539505 [Infundibulicybe gibba]|nr:hypothetical protein BD779DRAFT_1539505 [Infundibulicybe gibba]